jgi:hypothetical protein
MSTLREALARAITGAESGDRRPSEERQADAAILALRQWLADEGLVCVPLDFIAGPNAWLASWAQHVGNCKGGYKCECGLVAARHDLARAMVSAAMVSAAPDVLETKP